MSDSDFILKQWRKLLTDFKNDFDKWEKNTLGDYVARAADIVRNQIDHKIIDIEVSGISSYLFKQLDKEGIIVSERTIQRNLPDNYKRNYIISDNVSELLKDNWTEIPTQNESVLIETNQYNQFKINGVEQRAKQDKPPQPHTQEDTPKSSPDKTTRQFIYLSAMSKLANKIHLTYETLKARYNESNDTQFLIDKELGNVEKKLKQYATDWATIENGKGMIDLRRDYGEFEKVMACFMMETGETIARISQIMDYSEKYGSIGILREERVREFFETEETYPLYLRTCPSCRCDISQVMNRNISLYREGKNLDIDVPEIKYHKQ